LTNALSDAIVITNEMQTVSQVQKGEIVNNTRIVYHMCFGVWFVGQARMQMLIQLVVTWCAAFSLMSCSISSYLCRADRSPGSMLCSNLLD